MAIATPEFLHVRFPVITGADDIPVCLGILLGQAAGATHIPVTFLVSQKALEQEHGFFHIPIKIVALGFVYFL
jgi:hypothetical protein